MADGLPINTITALVQTRDGYLWLGTNDGVARFDGVRFTVYNAGNTGKSRATASSRSTRTGRACSGSSPSSNTSSATRVAASRISMPSMGSRQVLFG